MNELGSNIDTAPKAQRRVKKPEDSSWIILDDQEDIPPSGLPLSHNGNAIMIKTGVPVLVPNKYLGILDDAIISRPVLDPVTKQAVEWRSAPKYPYRRVPAPAEAE